MKITLESTSKIVELSTPKGSMPARIWQGFTDKGIPVHAYITRIGVDHNADQTEFERDLQATAAPRPELDAIPARLVF